MRRLWGVALSVLVAGCSDPAADPARYYPPADRAQAGPGGGPDRLAAGGPARAGPGGGRPGRRVRRTGTAAGPEARGFAVLGPAPGDGPRVFTVKLTFDGPGEAVRARYVVFGMDPVWVFRHEDYDMLNHWGHPMPKK